MTEQRNIIDPGELQEVLARALSKDEFDALVLEMQSDSKETALNDLLRKSGQELVKEKKVNEDFLQAIIARQDKLALSKAKLESCAQQLHRQEEGAANERSQLSAKMREEAQKVQATTETLQAEKANLSKVRVKISETEAELAKLLAKAKAVESTIQQIETTLSADVQRLQTATQSLESLDSEAKADEKATQLRLDMEECESSIAKYAKSLTEDIRASAARKMRRLKVISYLLANQSEQQGESKRRKIEPSAAPPQAGPEPISVRATSVYSMATAAVSMALAALTSGGSKAPVAAAADAAEAAGATAMQARAAIEQAVEPAREASVKAEVVCLDSSGDHGAEDNASAPAAGGSADSAEDAVEDEGSDAEEEVPAKRKRAPRAPKTYAKDVQEYIEYVNEKHKEFGPRNKRRVPAEYIAWHTYRDLHSHMYELRTAITRVYKGTIHTTIEQIVDQIDPYTNSMCEEIKKDADRSLFVARTYLADPSGTKTAKADNAPEAQGASEAVPAPVSERAGASKAVPAPVSERAGAGASKAVQAEEPPKRATRAQVENALKNVRTLKFHLDRNIVSKQRAAQLDQDSDAEDSRARLQEMEARSAAYTEQIEKLQNQLQKPDRQTFRMLYDAELYESKA
jgi:hypothetical protein